MVVEKVQFKGDSILVVFKNINIKFLIYGMWNAVLSNFKKQKSCLRDEPEFY